MLNGLPTPPGYKRRGCPSYPGGCNCTGACQELIPDGSAVHITNIPPAIDYKRLAREIIRQKKLMEEENTEPANASNPTDSPFLNSAMQH